MSRTYQAIAVGVFLCGVLHAQDIEITAFHHNGEIEWTNSMTNVSCSVEWASSLAPTAQWERSWCDLDYILTTSLTTTASVPMFYRVVCDTNTIHVPYAEIDVDGSPSDWQNILPVAESPLGWNHDEGPPGADVKSLHIAMSNSTLYFLFGVWTNQLDQTGKVHYRLWVDNNLNGQIDEDSFDRQVSAYAVGGGNYDVSCQHMADWWPSTINAAGQAVGSGSYLEGSIDFGALGIDRVFRLEAGTHSGSSITNYDRFPEVNTVILER